MHLGVTGHRDLIVSDQLTAAIRTVLSEARTHAESRHERLVLVSPLAEGADRLAAWLALSAGGIELRVLLPLPQDDYCLDFTTAASRRDFAELLKRAALVETLPAQESRPMAYLAVGKELVRRSDMLLAVWDGQPARGLGGSADVVAFARSLGLPLFWVDPFNAAQIVREGV